MSKFVISSLAGEMFANNRIVEKFAVKSDIQLEKDHKLVSVRKYFSCSPDVSLLLLY